MWKQKLLQEGALQRQCRRFNLFKARGCRSTSQHDPGILCLQFRAPSQLTYIKGWSGHAARTPSGSVIAAANLWGRAAAPQRSRECIQGGRRKLLHGKRRAVTQGATMGFPFRHYKQIEFLVWWARNTTVGATGLPVQKG